MIGYLAALIMFGSMLFLMAVAPLSTATDRCARSARPPSQPPLHSSSADLGRAGDRQLDRVSYPSVPSSSEVLQRFAPPQHAATC
jgi:hypothetical protein